MKSAVKEVCVSHICVRQRVRFFVDSKKHKKHKRKRERESDDEAPQDEDTQRYGVSHSCTKSFSLSTKSLSRSSHLHKVERQRRGVSRNF